MLGQKAAGVIKGVRDEQRRRESVMESETVVIDGHVTGEFAVPSGRVDVMVRLIPDELDRRPREGCGGGDVLPILWGGAIRDREIRRVKSHGCGVCADGLPERPVVPAVRAFVRAMINGTA
ncbi:hypothetical protein [Microbacterium gorillae]|uniref:hypothetical protein n=1 Tax=Microbacterium gorillae TaxID=1231063 RepID=UPI000590135F|nr:hypothetical protein [Microbacterium gorillae]